MSEETIEQEQEQALDLNEQVNLLNLQVEQLKSELDKLHSLPVFCAQTNADRTGFDALKSIFRKK